MHFREHSRPIEVQGYQTHPNPRAYVSDTPVQTVLTGSRGFEINTKTASDSFYPQVMNGKIGEQRGLL